MTRPRAIGAWLMVAFLLGTQDSQPLNRAALAALFREGRFDELIQRLTPTLDDTRASAERWVMVAEAELKLDHAERAVRAFETARRLDPALDRVTINYGFALIKAGRGTEARQFFTPRATAGDARAWLGIGLIENDAGRGAEARAAFERAVQIDPADDRSHYRLGQLLLDAGEYAAAITQFAAALRIDPLHHGAAYGLARAHARAGHAADAAQWSERHRQILAASDAIHQALTDLRTAADPVAARVAIAERFRALGAVREAIVWLRRAQALGPRDPAIQRQIDDLQRLTESAPAESRR